MFWGDIQTENGRAAGRNTERWEPYREVDVLSALRRLGALKRLQEGRHVLNILSEGSKSCKNTLF